MKKMQQQQ